jgi:hypothetical protein
VRPSACTAIPSRRLGLLGGQDKGQDGDGQQPTGKTGERFKVACGCQPPRSFWIRAKQYTPGPITCDIYGRPSNPWAPRLATNSTVESHPGRPPRSSGGVEADPSLIGQVGHPLGSQHRWEGAKHAWQAPGGHHRHALDDDLAPGNLGTVDGHNRQHYHARVGQDLRGLVGLP